MSFRLFLAGIVIGVLATVVVMRIRRGFTNQATTNQDQVERPETGSLANRQHAGAGAIAIRVARQAPPSGGNPAESSPPLPEPDPTGAAADNANGQAKRKMAILIDAENQPGQRIGPVFAALERDFDVSVRRAYADWENPVLRSWLQTCHDQDIERVQVHPSPGLVKVKNRADVALSEDAIALSDERRLDAVCIVSGDSDFLPVVRSLQAKGLFVVGAEASGATASGALIRECDLWLSTTVDPVTGITTTEPRDTIALAASDPVRWDELVLKVLSQREAGSDRGWIRLSTVGAVAREIEPTFDHKDYGAGSLRSLILTRRDLFEVEMRYPTPGRAPDAWMRKRAIVNERLDHRGTN